VSKDDDDDDDDAVVDEIVVVCRRMLLLMKNKAYDFVLKQMNAINMVFITTTLKDTT
jgi:hypothetical protein